MDESCQTILSRYWCASETASRYPKGEGWIALEKSLKELITWGIDSSVFGVVELIRLRCEKPWIYGESQLVSFLQVVRSSVMNKLLLNSDRRECAIFSCSWLSWVPLSMMLLESKDSSCNFRRLGRITKSHFRFLIFFGCPLPVSGMVRDAKISEIT
jgi:hypothetical protein